MEKLIIVTDWEKVEADNFYLSDDWTKHEEKENIKSARKLQKENNLYLAYIVSPLSYAIYTQMDADQVFIDNDLNVILHCESAVINNDHQKRVEYEY